MQELVHESLQIVGEELAVTFNDVRRSLELYADGDRTSQSLERCQALLHTAIGVLKMTETYGASLLTEEMESTCRFLAALRNKEEGSDEAMEALSRAAVQLPSYVERIINGGQDIPLVLLPLLNDLRAARGKPLLSESTLLLLNLGSPQEQKARVTSREISGEDIARLSKQLRPPFQLALLGWIKNTESRDSLAQIAEVAGRLEQAAATLEVHQLFWVTGGTVEALLDGGLETGVSLKRLIGQVDREMKRLITVGEAKYAEQPPTELVNNLLYYIARATSGGPRVTAIRAAFSLSNLIPADDQVEMVRESLAAPSAKLMHTVAQAIRDDLARVKDVLDIFVRTGMENVDELGPQIELLKKIGDTLGVLGLGELREDIEERRQRLLEIIESGQPVEEGVLMEMAAALLRVEDHVDERLFGLIRPPEHARASGEPAAEPVNADHEVVSRAVIREALINLARVKDAVTQVLQQPSDTSLLDSVPQNLRGITAGLLIIEKEAAISIVDEIGDFIRQLVEEGYDNVNQMKLDLLADAIVSLEYYLETLQAGRKEPIYMLDNARSCLNALRGRAPKFVPDHLSDKEISASATTIQAPENAETVPVPPPARAPDEADLAMQTLQIRIGGDGEVSPDLIELFIEEAGEAIETVNKLFPAWEQDENEHDALAEIRRAMHTLKGSGHVVGANLMGEFCWSIENLLNRIINGTVERGPEIVEFLGTAINVLPELLEQLEIGTAPKSDAAALMAQAAAYATGQASVSRPPPAEDRLTLVEGSEAPEIGDAAAARDRQQHVEGAGEAREPAAVEAMPEIGEDRGEEAGEELAATPGDVTAQAAAPGEGPTPEFDPALLEILTKETASHLDVIRNFVEECRGGLPPFDIPEEVYRACHTLHGSVTMAKADAAAELTRPLNQMVRQAFDHRLPVEDSVVTALADAGRALAVIVECLSDMSREMPDFDELRARLMALAGDLEGRVAQLADEARDASPDLEFDAEIAKLFAEEASELLESIDAALARSAEGPLSSGTLEALQRDLHTLKGGARMAGLMPMGDLSHDLETYLARIAGGQVRPRPELLQETVDELHRLGELVTRGTIEAPPQDLLDRLHAALEADDAAGASAEPAEDAALVRVAEEEETGAPPVTPMQEDVAAAAADEATETESPLEQSRPAKVEEQLGKLARELREPPKPVAGDIAELVSSPVPAEQTAPDRREFARIDPAVLEKLLNNAGEVSIFHSRLGQQLGQIQFNLDELGQTVLRLREQLRSLEVTTEAQILYQHEPDVSMPGSRDPLKLERYSKIQQLSRSLAETANDVSSLRDMLQNVTGETEALLVQQARTAGELQDGLMRTRMVPFQQHAARLARLVRQMASEHGKQAELTLTGGGEIDRQVLEKMLPPFEHMLRNAVIHGIESPAERMKTGKTGLGRISIEVHREGPQIVIEISDDGRGMDIEAIRRKAIELGIAQKTQVISDEEALQFVLRPGFSTADRLTQASGRGIGMDVVANEVARLGGTLRMDTKSAEGTTITVRLPVTLAVTQALIVRAGSETYALPLPTVEGIIRISRAEFLEKMADEEPVIDYGGQTYRLRHLGQYLGLTPGRLPEEEDRVSIVLVRAGSNSTALVTDEMLDSREVIVKPIGNQLAAIPGISGATILGDGRVAIILDPGALVRSIPAPQKPSEAAPAIEPEQSLALVVDDSITMRRVSQRLLERNGYRVVTARDGLDAIEMLRDHRPDIILLDVEMPRMDGYEFASFVRNNPDTETVPIIMITSRVSDKHKARAIEIGVNDYLGKPYQESVLLEAVQQLLKTD